MNELKRSIQRIIEQVVDGEEELLVQPIDHAEAVGSEPVTDEPEVIDHATGKVVKISDRTFSMNESSLRGLIRNILGSVS